MISKSAVGVAELLAELAEESPLAFTAFK